MVKTSFILLVENHQHTILGAKGDSPTPNNAAISQILGTVFLPKNM